MTHQMSTDKQRIAALKFELARSKLIAVAKGVDPELDDTYVALLIRLETAEADRLWIRMTGGLPPPTSSLE